ncbi:dihydrofolate reductase family protein [Larkinella rosea]|uniref:Dihydrofolate reductase n=1 Tax=Larkinella rosea TaxID=2025312 RepID=A0A3P1C2J8_9BACT|nr:dihydrofolate reductase family protein [Larkinella rosea]RRB07326.1 dihydrofolate reductase [Larkinella rosea]
MRKVKLQIQISLDGFVATQTGEQYWMSWNWDDILNQYVADLADTTDTMLIGRVTYEGMANYWPDAATNPDADKDEAAFAKKMNAITKVVFSHTLDHVTWCNSRLATENAADEIAKLKQQSGKDIIVYGGATMVSSLIKSGIIDEYHLFVNPVVLGTGMPIWHVIQEQLKLKLIKMTTSSTGIVILCYQPEK